MSKLLLLNFLLLISVISFGQKKEKEEDAIDTTSNTVIERLLRQTSITKKIEFVEVEKVKVLQFQIILITNLKTGTKVKGLYLSNKSGTNIWTGVIKGERHAYLDENEIADMISFLENCDSKWKIEKPLYQTQYEFETLDNLKISFWTKKNSNSWVYTVKFSSYIFDNTEELRKSQSDELLDALKQVEAELKNH
jgi:hypothetical protein